MLQYGEAAALQQAASAVAGVSRGRGRREVAQTRSAGT